MFRRKKVPKSYHEGENPFLLSFSDFMVSLLAIFILIVVVMVVQVRKMKDSIPNPGEGHWVSNAQHEKWIKLDKAVSALLEKMKVFDSMKVGFERSLDKAGQRRKELQQIISDIKTDLERQGVAVTPDLANLCLRFRDDKEGSNAPRKLLFNKGSSEIPIQSQLTANIVGESLLKALSNARNQQLIDTVFIEGHTDSIPDVRPKGNWGLSAERAISLWQFWTESPGKLVALRNLRSISEQGDEKPMISVSGYADTRSTYSKEELSALPNDRPDDRRIEIRFTLAAYEKEGLDDIQAAWNNVLSWFPEEIQLLRGILKDNESSP
jgi:flagellar motor protein MotB